VKLSLIAPDVTLSDLNAALVDLQQDVLLLGELARGGFGVVSKIDVLK
jgi:hypothetical protein